jgi:hypothetical protein
MRFLVHFAVILTVSLFVLEAAAAPEIEQASDLWSKIATAVHNVGVP